MTLCNFRNGPQSGLATELRDRWVAFLKENHTNRFQMIWKN